MCIAGVQRAMVLVHTDAGRPLELPDPWSRPIGIGLPSRHVSSSGWS